MQCPYCPSRETKERPECTELGTIKQRYQNRHSPGYSKNDRFSSHFPTLKVTDTRRKFLSEKPG